MLLTCSASVDKLAQHLGGVLYNKKARLGNQNNAHEIQSPICYKSLASTEKNNPKGTCKTEDGGKRCLSPLGRTVFRSPRSLFCSIPLGFFRSASVQLSLSLSRSVNLQRIDTCSRRY